MERASPKTADPALRFETDSLILDFLVFDATRLLIDRAWEHQEDVSLPTHVSNALSLVDCMYEPSRMLML